MLKRIPSARSVVIGIVAVAVILLGVLILSKAPDAPEAPDFSQYAAGRERKQAFFGYFLPIVLSKNQDILEQREELLALRQQDSLGKRDRNTLETVATKYAMSDFDPATPADWDTLLRRVDIVPPSLALAQAANESAWGTSRFAREGNNFFGQWCFKAGCGIVPASRDAGKSHEVADFSDPSESVDAYITNLNRHLAYRQLRDIREKLRDQGEEISGVDLAAGLVKYSERGPEYVKELRAMIRHNKLDEYDTLAAIAEPSPSG